jgi:Flp pilus assembly protein TadD
MVTRRRLNRQPSAGVHSRRRWAYDAAMKRALAAVGWAALVGCAGLPPAPLYSRDEDAFRTLVLASDIAPAPDEDVLALPPEADALLADTLAGKTTTEQKIRALARLFGPDGALQMRYELMSSGTAAETLERRAGSCLAYTNLYIALARRVGIDARFREVLTVEQWDRAGDYAILNRHVVAYGQVPMVGTYTMDFGLLGTVEGQLGRVIGDARARAQHFNNRGAAALTEGDARSAVASFNRALLIDRSLAYVWSNLGTAYIRLGRPDAAEAALRWALTLEPYQVTPMNQLARLYQLEGEVDLADEYLARAGKARLRNPYVLYQQGLEARNQGELERAIGLFRRALRGQPDEVHFLIELATTYRMSGRLDRARKAFFAADERATTLEERAALLQALEETARSLRESDT